MYEEMFSARLTQLRTNKGISARDMSLSLGQNPGYINNIETGKSLPSMSAFFYICEYLEIAPKDFFDTDSPNPEKLGRIIEYLKKMNSNQLDLITSVSEEMIK